jgi:hypothetical protein
MQTAIDAMDPRSVIELLDELKSAVSSVTAAEQALMKSKAERLSALRREAQRHAEAESTNLDVRIHQLAADFKHQAEVEQFAMEARPARIQSAYHASKASLAQRIQARKDRKIGRVQGDIMRNRQMRQQELEQAVARHQ